ncbi:MAG TPA: agmatine deiminase family protein, partial [Verrucomicrobiota bacterium]|nr:agmatine deiminase family protein [Verrucomicrobiota bacterium]
TFVTDGGGRRAGIAWRFNAWGEKFHPYDQDAKLARRILGRRGERVFAAPVVLEGGAFGGDGGGIRAGGERGARRAGGFRHVADTLRSVTIPRQNTFL